MSNSKDFDFLTLRYHDRLISVSMLFVLSFLYSLCAAFSIPRSKRLRSQSIVCWYIGSVEPISETTMNRLADARESHEY